MRRLPLESGAAIANARGVPGTLGFLAMTRHDRRIMMVTSHHVLFGASAREDEPVWLDGRARADGALERIGHAAYGRAGLVRTGETDVWVDCAAAYIDQPLPFLLDDGEDSSAEPSLPLAGMPVSKLGAATGTTRGTVADVCYTDFVASGSQTVAAPGQILVRPSTGGAFCEAGDSGAALRDERGIVIGLMWGRTPHGEGVACPIAPVLQVLHAYVLPGASRRPAPLVREVMP
jgi:hypothetical protein